jgi:hypothetical protein
MYGVIFMSPAEVPYSYPAIKEKGYFTGYIEKY